MLVLGIALAVLAVLGIGYWIRGQIEGFRDDIAFTGRTMDDRPIEILVGKTRLAVPANMIRFPEGRRAGPAEKLDLLLLWPDMAGFNEKTAEAFRKMMPEAPLLALTLTPTSGAPGTTARLDTSYTPNFSDDAWAGPNGLVGVKLTDDSGYAGENLFFQPESEEPFVTRCLPEGNPEIPATCLREITLDGLDVLYRFDANMLADWARFDEAVKARVDGFRLR